MRHVDFLVRQKVLHMQGVIDQRVEEKEAAQKEEKDLEDLAEEIAFPELFKNHSIPRAMVRKDFRDNKMIKG